MIFNKENLSVVVISHDSSCKQSFFLVVKLQMDISHHLIAIKCKNVRLNQDRLVYLS